MGFAVADALKEAQELYNESLDALRDQRLQIAEDLKFSDPSDPQQWEDDVKLRREGDPGGKRPCLVHDQTGQYVANVAGQVEKQPPSIHAIPVGGGAEKQTAEQIDGRFRHVEYASRATQHYTRVLTSVARSGVGYLVIRPEYSDRAMGYQEPRIGSEPDPLKVVFDPWSVDTDGKDANFGYILTAMSVPGFTRKWPKAEQRDFGDLESSGKRDNRKSVLVAEQFYKEWTNKNTVLYLDENGQEASADVSDEDFAQAVRESGAPYKFVRSYKDKSATVHWRHMSGAEVLEESIYPADYIGIVPVYGYVSFANGRMTYCGIARRARAPQQAYNYHISEQLAYIATTPKTPWIASKRAIAGVESLWERSSIETRGVLPFVDLDNNGPINAPTRTNTVTNIQAHEQGALQAKSDIQAAIGMYQANLGAPSNETSGVAIDNRKEQGEASTAHFPSHMAASLGQVGQIVMQMDANLADTKRKQPILGVDGSSGSVTVDPDQESAFKRIGPGVSINPKVGQYGVRVVVGASYSTQRTQTNAAFTEIIRSSKDPQLTATVLPFWAQTLDFPGSDKFAQAVAAMSPAPVKAILQPEGADKGPDPAMLAQQLDQCKQALQEALQHARAAQQDADEAVAELAGVKADKDVDHYKAETDRLKVTGANDEQIQAIVQQMVNDMLSGPAPLPGDGEPPIQGAPQPGPAAPEPEITQEPQGPAPEIVALTEGQQQLSQSVDQLGQGQQQLASLLQELAALTKRGRKRVPVRDQNGDITEVIESLAEE